MKHTGRKHGYSGPRRTRGRAIVIVLAALAALLGSLIVARGLFDAAVEYQAASIYPEARPVQPFELNDADGEPFTEDDLKGELTLLFFGFTNCPDICPDTLGMLADAMDKLDAMRVEEKPEVVFVSVDPERDAGETMRDYAAYFDPSFRAVTGDHPALNALTGQLGVMYARQSPNQSSGNDGYYTVDHSGSIVIVDAAGRVTGRFPATSAAESVAADLFAMSRR